jgi:O-Antigen ligase
MIHPFTLGLALLAVAGLGLMVIETLMQRAELGAAFMLAVTVMRAYLLEAVPALTVGGPRVELPDVAFCLVLVAAIARLTRVSRFTSFQRCLVLLSVMLVLSLARGIMQFGIEPSVSEFRLHLYFLCGALYFSTFPLSATLNDRVGKVWLMLSIPMILLVCIRWLNNFAGVDLGVPAEKFGADAAIRVIDGPYTFFLAHTFMLTMPVWQMRDHQSKRIKRFSLLVLLFVVLLNRRTVWLTMIAGTVVLILRNPRIGQRILVMAAAAALVTAAVFTTFSRSATQEEPLARSASNTGTLEWRIAGWSELVASWEENPAHWLIGQPFGSGYGRRIEGTELSSPPHNFYLETLLRTGMIGLCTIIALTFGLLRKLWRTKAPSGRLLAPDLFPVLLTMQLIWFITWAPGWEQGIITGLALACTTMNSRGRLSPPSSEPMGDPGHTARPAVPSGPVPEPAFEPAGTAFVRSQ